MPAAICPCCGQPAAYPSLEALIIHTRYRPGDYAHSILTVLYRARGLPVLNSRLYDAMYADDPDGGPEQHHVLKAFKMAVFNLRSRLHGSGVEIVNEGYRLGYRLRAVQHRKRAGKTPGRRIIDSAKGIAA